MAEMKKAFCNFGIVMPDMLCVSFQNKPVQEDESKQIRCLNAQTLACCQFNQRTVLIVCSKYWQVCLDLF